MHFVIKRNGDNYSVYYGLKRVVTVSYPYRDDVVHALVTSGFVDKRNIGQITMEIEE